MKAARGLRGNGGKDFVLPPVRPNEGISAEYRKKLLKMVDEMARSYAWFLKAQYRETPPIMARDASPAREIRNEVRRLARRWERNFDDGAPKLAKWFARSAQSRSDAVLKKILRDAGFSVKFQRTPAMRDATEAIVAENVSLIKSIASQFHTEVEGMVMRSVVAGRDLSELVSDLQHRFGVTRRRAELIGRDQNNKATSAFRRIRETDLGIEEGVWLHSHAGKEPRPTHVKQSGNKFNLREGWHDPDPKVDRNIWPGELINCRCTWKAVVKGFS